MEMEGEIHTENRRSHPSYQCSTPSIPQSIEPPLVWITCQGSFWQDYSVGWMGPEDNGRTDQPNDQTAAVTLTVLR